MLGTKILTPTFEFADFIGFAQAEVEGSITARFEQVVRRYAHRLAVKDPTQALSYAALNRAANRLAHALLQQYGDANEPVALLMDQSVWASVAIIGALKARKIYVPLDPCLPHARLAAIRAHAQARLIVSDDQHWAQAEARAREGCALLNVESLDAALPTSDPALPIAPDALACILHTSGSTGQPKGVMHTHRTVLHFIANYTNAVRLCAHDRFTLLYANNVIGAVRDTFGALLNGASLFPYDVRARGVAGMAAWLNDERITIYNSVTSVFREFARALNGDEQFPTVRLVKVGGEPTYRGDVDLFRRYFSRDAVLYLPLGSTEMGNCSDYFLDAGTQFEGERVPVGYPVHGMEVLLLDDAGKPVCGDQVGEIVVKSRYLSPGYWRQPTLTDAVFRADPHGGDARRFHSGDLAYRLPDDCLVHLGRKDFQIKIRGHRVETGEIELALRALPSITEAVVVADDEPPRLVAYVVAQAKPAPTASELRCTLAEQLPDYMIPTVFVPMDKFQRTSNGKIDRQALPPPACSARAAYTAPRTPVEDALARIWCDVLQTAHIGVYDHFLDLGGNSLLAARVVARVLKEFRVELPMRALFDTPSVATMAALIVQQQATLASDDELERLLNELDELTETQALRLVTVQHE